ncbi:Gag/polymerase/env polyprotein [Rasamsonia emersonii CBS 393.64]|uniref:Gag/polymerase/env polyprotein n=1 Tax=Rasamsonia emersonii (strain ATCC 16479 / CBS 393.64 / IMI 116815) TaxID=1408163 RepID=A0A0F4YUW2_RASE3|nr:Gag/polymerase/env polyprotein [Rasamsonia emersonii CBS 393.64]KKA22077.1 Gag/polymerase/env polyprotein [Rasamsonia emersonii CBS 393.64]
MARPSSEQKPPRRMTLLLEGRPGEPREIDREEFITYCRDDPERLWQLMLEISDELRDKIEDLEVEAAGALLKIQENEGIAALANQELKKKEDELKQTTIQRDQYANQIAQMMVRSNDLGTLAVGPATRKSIKLPDPPLLSDGKNPKFDDWLVLMQQKLSANADHYDTPELRRAYVASRCEGDAAKHITKRLKNGAINAYKDSTDLLEHLEQIYHDPNRLASAKLKFRGLFMKNKDKFHDFLSEFIYWADEAEIDEKDWREELYQKITTDLQKLTMSEAIRTNGTFQEFINYCSQTANRLEVINNRSQHNRVFRNWASSNQNQNSPVPTNTVKRESKEADRLGVDSETRQRLMQEGKCFKCQQFGHLARECPKQMPTTQLKALEKANSKENNENIRDTGANGFIFIDTNLATLIAKTFGLHTVPLGREYAVQGYDGKSEAPVTHAIFMTLEVDGRRQNNLPMLIVNLGRHDIILGRKWFAQFGVLPDCKNQRLLWPSERAAFDEVAAQTTRPLPRKILKRADTIQMNYQKDADRRDRLMEQEDQEDQKKGPNKVTTGDRKPISPAAPRHQPRELFQPTDPIPLEPEKKIESSQDLPKIDIAAIGGSAFTRYMKGNSAEVFVTSLYEIDKMIQHKKPLCDITEEADLRKLVPSYYHDYLDVFSKRASDTLPPSRPCDHKIELTMENTLGYSPLYKQSAEELEATKKYIMENLDKGFIEPSNAPFASPILMARKKDGGLRFCVDYRKLNAITKRDRYPLPASPYPDAPDSEDLTTFRTRYGSYKYKVMPFGLTNGPATFQRFINETFLDYLDDFLTAFIDDLLIYSSNELEHQEHVKKVLQRLREAGLQASIGKCEFHVQRTKYLGFVVGTNGIEVDPDKVAVIAQWKRPTTVKGVQSFLGSAISTGGHTEL